MSPQKPFVSPPGPLNKSKDHYKFQGVQYKHLEVNINLASLKTIAIAILLGAPYLGFIVMLYSWGLKIIATIMIGAFIMIGGLIGFLYYFNREQPVKAPANQKKRF